MTMLTDLELTALRTLPPHCAGQPTEALRWRGALYVRYMVQFWRVDGEGRCEAFHGAFPNGAMCEGVERIQVQL
jgi:hypothetical protein